MPTSPTPITALPTPPSRSDPANFAARGDAFLGALPTFATEANAIATNAYSNALETVNSANTASSAASTATAQADAAMGYRNAAQTAATTATTKANEASASATAASKLNLGDKASPPTTDNQGQPLRAGATYYDTTLGKWRVWTGTAWGDGISVVAGVSSLNGESGDLVKTTLTGYGITDAQKALAAEVKSAAFTAENGGVYACDTSGGGFTVTLPASPQPGWKVDFLDYAGSFDTRNLTVAHNGSKILGTADNYVLNQKNRGRTFTYINATKGWLVK